MARRFIVGRQMIVGHGMGRPAYYAGADYTGADPHYDELMQYSAGADPGAPGTPVQGVHARGTPVAYDRAPGPRVIEEHPTHTREFPIGFTSSSDIPPNVTQQIETKPQVLFRGERLAVPNSLVLNFQVADIKVGKDSQLAAPGNMPAECFSNVSVGVRMQLDTAEPGITLTLFMENTDAHNAHPFSSVLYGTVIE
jgi:hypothetical protein